MPHPRSSAVPLRLDLRISTIRRHRSASRRAQAIAGYAFSGPFALLLLAFGIYPAVYALYLSFVSPSGGFAGISNFITVFNDYRFATTVANVSLYTLVFLVPTVVISVGLAILLHSRKPIIGSAFRFVYYLPNSVIGIAGVLLWLFLLTPSVSPIGGILRFFGYDNLFNILPPSQPFNLAVVFAVIAVWTSGQSILLMFAALSSIPPEVEEAALIDGATGIQTVWYVKLPMLRKWIAYLIIISIGASTQLFAEPQLISAVTGGAVGTNFSPLQLAYTFAYQYVNFPAASAISLMLLVVGIAAAALVVRTTGLFKLES